MQPSLSSAVFSMSTCRSVLDLGCGTAILGIAAVMLGAGHVLGVDVDPAALAIAAGNIDALEIDNMDLLCCDARACAVRHHTSDVRSAMLGDNASTCIRS